PTHRTNSWRRTINDARDAIQDLLMDSPSLATELTDCLPEAYKRARRDACDLMPNTEFPDICPWSLDTVRDPGFWTESGPTIRGIR
ncbi:MAG: DUF29 domain-containing protein, partial [Candidatus Binataceae bacterium]